MGTVRPVSCRRAVLQLHARPRMEADRAGRRGCACLTAQPRHVPCEGAVGGSPFRMEAGRGMGADTARWPDRDRPSHGRYCNARPLGPACLDSRGGRPLAATRPSLCINRSRRGRSGGVSGTHRASFPVEGPGLRRFRGRGPLTTDRLVTPFHASRAQSGPRKVSPMNFSRGSRSIQRLLAARPLLTCWSRGRA